MNADARKAAERLQRWANDHRKMGEPTTTVLYQDMRSVAEAILYASPSPSPTPSREAVARIIDPTAFEPMTGHIPIQRQKDALAKADAILALALPPAPQGWRLVPEEPTEAMLDSAENALSAYIEGVASKAEITARGGHTAFRLSPRDKATIRYRAMLSAAPAQLERAR